MRLTHTISVLSWVVSALAAPSTSVLSLRQQASGFAWGSEKVRGVNIGGWLVLEPWITPSIFERYPVSRGIVDEFTLCQKLGKPAARNILKPHWDSWVSLADFQKIQQAGFNLVRIPIGFWAYQQFGSPYVQGAAPYLDKAIGWARQTGLKVIIDLHGAPRSQNGFDNSGHRIQTPQWGQGNSIPQTLQVLNQMSTKYAGQAYRDVVAGIELLNEPAGFALDINMIRKFHQDGFATVRRHGQAPVVFSDAFKNPRDFNDMLNPPQSQNAIIDHHYYQVFSPEEVGRTPAQHLQAVCNDVPTYAGANKWTIVGEFTGAMTDCATWLNGYGRGARYDGTYMSDTRFGSCQGKNNIATWSPQMRTDTRKFIELQLNTFEKHVEGWVWWNFKTERSPEWDAFKLLDAGIFPNPVTNRRFPRTC